MTFLSDFWAPRAKTVERNKAEARKLAADKGAKWVTAHREIVHMASICGLSARYILSRGWAFSAGEILAHDRFIPTNQAKQFLRNYAAQQSYKAAYKETEGYNQ